jgi:hypothetical protein
MASRKQNAVFLVAAVLVPVGCMFGAMQLIYSTGAYDGRDALAVLGLVVGFTFGLVLFSRIVFASRAVRFFATGAYLLVTFLLLMGTQLFTACTYGACL